MRRLFVLIVSLLLVGFLVACGEDDSAGAGENGNDNGDDTGQETSQDTEQETTVTTVEEGKLLFGSSGLYKPFNFEDLDGNETGFEVDLGIALAEEMGLEPEPVFTQDFGALIEEVNAGRIDVIMGSLTITEERAEAVDFSRHYYTSGPLFYVHEDTNDIETWDDLDGKMVGVISDSVYEEEVLQHIPEENLATYQSDTVALQDLAAGTGRLDMVLTDKIVGLVQIDENDLNIKAVGDFIFEEKIGAAVKKDNEEMLNEINRALDAIIDNGTYAEISEKWFGENILD